MTKTNTNTTKLTQQLDNPTWHALTGPQSSFAEGTGLARRFRTDVAMFAAIADDSADAWNDLGALVGSGAIVILNRRDDFDAPAGWTLLGGGDGYQMVLEGAATVLADAPGTRLLTDDDVPEMVELVKLTEPGPFRSRTIELGGYRGIFADGRLLAMAGQRIALDGYTEISAVCTHPEARRQGYAAAITASVARGIQAEGKTPILHVAGSNVGAKRVYDQLGFATRTVLMFAAFRAP